MATIHVREDSGSKSHLREKNRINNVKSHLQVLQDCRGKKRDYKSGRMALQPIENRITRQESKRTKWQELDVNVPAIKVEGKRPAEAVVKVEDTDVETLKAHLSNIGLVSKDKAKRYVGCDDGIKDLESHVEYLRDIWNYLVSMEKSIEWPRVNYMSKQPHLTNNMRCILVDWLVSVADEYKLSEQTVHLSVNYIDRFLSRMSVVGEKFQLLGSAAMMIAGKVEDVYPPDSSEWAYLTGNTYTSQQVQKMEQLVLKVLQFDLQPPTMLSFIQQLCVEHGLDKQTMYLAMYISELVLLEGDDYLQYLPSKLASASVALARLTLSEKDPWPKKLEYKCGYSLKQLSPVVQRQNCTFADSPTKPHQAIQTKYKSSKFRKVALLKPKILCLDDSMEVEEG